MVPISAPGAYWCDLARYCLEVSASNLPGLGPGESVGGMLCGIDVAPPRDDAEERCEMFRRIGALRAERRPADALHLADELLERMRVTEGIEPIDIEIALNEKGQAHCDLEQWREAESAYIMAARLSARRRGGTPDPYFVSRQSYVAGRLRQASP